MKVSIVSPSFYPATVYGGPVFTSLHTAEELAKIGVEVWVSATNANMTERLDIKVNVWHKKNENFFVKYYNETIINYLSIRQIFSIWKDIRKVDVVSLQVLFRDLVPFVLLYAKIFKKPLMLTPHGTLGKWCLEGGSRFKSLWLDLFIRPFNSMIVWHATAEKEKMEILSIFSNANIVVIPNGVSVKEFDNYTILSTHEFTRKYTGKQSDTGKIIVSMGRLQRVKGFDVLIDSFVKILDQHPSSKLFIAGSDAGEEENLRNQIKKLDLRDKVFLVGQISGQEKIDFLANADLFVLASHNENFGMVYVESLAAGTPIVASRQTPWSEVEEANCGKWINNSVKETAQAMVVMLEKDRELMRINSKLLAKKYDWENIALQFKEVFEQMRRS
ncbi:MAG: glycosyltransferase [Bacteroidales bacterium]|nr:glycosyltransferase [Bacteroidales bacterium]